MREAKKGINHPLYGKNHSFAPSEGGGDEETKAQMSVAKKGNKNRLGKTHTEETIKKN